jgi:hypothetical protein
MCIQNIIISINGLDIMVTLGVYFKYIKDLCKIFNKYIVPILQVYPNYLIVHLKIIIDDIYYIILYYIFLLITYNLKKLISSLTKSFKLYYFIT